MFNPVTEIKGVVKLATTYGPARVAHRVAPMSNAEIYARTGLEPVTWVGGLGSSAHDYANMVRELQHRGLPVVASSTGSGTRPMAVNAQRFASTVDSILEQTGAAKSAAAGQSKGPQDIKTALDQTAVGDRLGNQYYLVSPHKGGTLPATDAVKQGSRMLRGAFDRLPSGVQDALRAWVELSPGSPELAAAKRGLQRFVKDHPEAQVHNYTSDITPERLPWGHDTLVSYSSQRLVDDVPTAIEHRIGSGPRHHVTVHLNDEFLDSIVELQRQARNRRMGLPADTPVLLPDHISVPGAKFQRG